MSGSGDANSVDGSAACAVHSRHRYTCDHAKVSGGVKYATCRNAKSVYSSGPTLTGASDLGRERRANWSTVQTAVLSDMRAVRSPHRRGSTSGRPRRRARTSAFPTGAKRSAGRCSTSRSRRRRSSSRRGWRRAGPAGWASRAPSSSGYRIMRSRRDIDSAPADHWTIYLQMHGRTTFEQNGEAVTLDRDDIAILDGRRPFRADFAGVGRRAVVKVPRQMIDRRAPWVRRRTLHRIPAGTQFADLARDHVVALTADDAPPDDSASIVLAENLSNLLGLASATDLPTEPPAARPAARGAARLLPAEPARLRADAAARRRPFRHLGQDRASAVRADRPDVRTLAARAPARRLPHGAARRARSATPTSPRSPTAGASTISRTSTRCFAPASTPRRANGATAPPD